MLVLNTQAAITQLKCTGVEVGGTINLLSQEEYLPLFVLFISSLQKCDSEQLSHIIENYSTDLFNLTIINVQLNNPDNEQQICEMTNVNNCYAIYPRTPLLSFLLTPRSFHPLLHVHLLCGDRVWGICGLHYPLQPETDSSYHQSHAKCSFQARRRAAGRRQARGQQLGGEEGAHSDAADGSECELRFSGECLLKTERLGEKHTRVDGSEGQPGGEVFWGRDAEVVKDAFEIIVQFLSESGLRVRKWVYLLNSLKM